MTYVGKCRPPKVTTWRGVIWPRDSLLPCWVGEGESREPKEREREREREREGQGVKHPSVGLGMI
jgi:hypothetical protein